jgi:hypothetical protein
MKFNKIGGSKPQLSFERNGTDNVRKRTRQAGPDSQGYYSGMTDDRDGTEIRKYRAGYR